MQAPCLDTLCRSAGLALTDEARTVQLPFDKGQFVLRPLLMELDSSLTSAIRHATCMEAMRRGWLLREVLAQLAFCVLHGST